MELSEHLNTYPDRRNSSFQDIINGIYEFISLTYKGSDKLDPNKGYFRHQLLMHRLLSVYNRMILIDDPGTGKTFSVVGFLEMIVQAKFRATLEPDATLSYLSVIKRMYIIVRNNAVKEEITYQIICKTPSGRYRADPSSTIDTKRAGLNALNKAGYSIDTYGDFTSMIAGMFEYDSDTEGNRKDAFIERLKEDESFRRRVRAELSDCAFWVDEAHNLVSSESKGKGEDEKNFKRNYKFIHTLFGVLDRSIQILSTATFAVNKYTEFFKLANIVVDRDGKLPEEMNPEDLNRHEFNLLFPDFPEDESPSDYSREELGEYYKPQFPGNYEGGDYYGDYSTELAVDDDINSIPQSEDMDKILSKTTYEFILTRLRGMMSYVRAENVDYDKVVVTSQLGNTEVARNMADLGFYTLLMSKNQTELYNIVSEEYKNEISGKPNRAAVFIFPPTSNVLKKSVIGNDVAQYKLHFTSNGYLRDNSSLRKIFQSDKKTMKYGAKLVKLKEIVQEEDGLVVVVSDHVDGSGCYLIAEYLSVRLGLDRYEGSSSLLTDMTPDVKVDYCSGQKGLDSLIPPNTNNPSVAIITGTNSVGSVANIKDAASSPYNIHGELLKVVIISSAASEGVSFLGASAVVLMNSKWTDTSKEQAEARGVRTNSYTIKGPILDEEFLQEHPGETPPRHQIKIYRLVALKNNGEATQDVPMYLRARKKGIPIKIMKRYAMMMSVTCPMNRGRNIRPEDKDYSVECQYLKCGYKCDKSIDNTNRKIDYSGYDLYYAEDDIDDAMNKIIKLFIGTSSISIRELKNVMNSHYPEIRAYTVESAIIRIVSEKIPVKDKYGMQCYVREDGDTFVLDRDYPSNYKVNMLSHIYTDDIIVVKKMDIAEISNSINTYSEEELLKFISIDRKARSLARVGTVHNKAQVMEYIIMKQMYGEDVDMCGEMRKLYDLLIQFFYTTEEPVTELYKVDAKMKSGNHGTGRRISVSGAKGHVKAMIAKGEILQKKEKNEGAVTVWFHTLYGQKASLSKGNISNNFIKPPRDGDMRIIRKHLDSEWRSATDLEYAIYRYLIRVSTVIRMADIAGGVDRDGTLHNMIAFRLEDESVRFANNVGGKSRTCVNMSVFDIMLTASRNDLIESGVTSKLSEEQRLQKINKILELTSNTKNDIVVKLKKYTDKELMDTSHFLTSEKQEGKGATSKENICDELYSILKEQGRVMEGMTEIVYAPLPITEKEISKNKV